MPLWQELRLELLYLWSGYQIAPQSGITDSHEDTGWRRQLKHLHAKDLRAFPATAEDAQKTFP